jgi:glycosyltransferase involved in cell wall biosynthesis
VLLASMSLRVIALLGRKDEPTDAVEEYCRYLASALQPYDIQLEIRRVPWPIRGWTPALRGLKRMAEEWRGTWVLVQYTALAWSTRGFPQRVLRVLHVLKSAGARVAIVFHDVEPYQGTRLIDRLRRFVQFRTMRRSLVLVDLTIFTVPTQNLSWLRQVQPPQAHFIPVGANLPIPEGGCAVNVPLAHVIGVFSITGGDAGVRETQLIVSAVRYAAEKLGHLKLLVFGRHAELREATLRNALRDLPVDLLIEGVVEPHVVLKRLASCGVLFFVRGHISSRRGSAIAGIACGLPIIAVPGSETAPPITDAGVILIPPDHPEQLNEALVRVLADPDYRAELAARSRAAYQEHFSWIAIARRFAAVLRAQ